MNLYGVAPYSNHQDLSRSYPMPTIDVLEIYTLGQVLIKRRAQAESIVISPRETALLIYLAYHRVPMHRAHLTRLFWPDETSQRAQGNLRKLLVDMRQTLGDALAVDRETVSLHQTLEYWLDIHEFQWHMQPLSQASPAPIALNTLDIPRLIQGVNLYRGEFLAGFKKPKSRVFCTWLEQEQQNLQQQMLAACKVLIVTAKNNQAYTEAIHYAKRILASDPLDEETQEQFMTLLAMTGEVEAAVRHYQAYCQLLKKEVAGKPEPQLTRLYQQIRARALPIRPIESNLVSTQTTQSQNSVQKQLPKPLTPLLGHQNLLFQLQHAMTDPLVRLVTLVGMGGIGKTRVALAVAEQLAPHFANRVVLISLEAELKKVEARGESRGTEAKKWTDDSQSIAHELAQITARVLNAMAVTDLPPLTQVVNYVREKSYLLIFDGFEQWMAGASFLTELLQEAPLVKILVTSREDLELPGAVMITLEGLPLPPLHQPLEEEKVPEVWLSTTGRMSGEEWIEQQAPSLQLFLQCVQRQTNKFPLQPDSLQAITQICHLVEGNPLAIELAAGLVVHYSWQEIAERLHRELDILSTTHRGRIPRHRSMTTVIQDSWQLLTPQEQITLSHLSIFTDGFSRNAALAITGSPAETLVALVNKSLVRSKGAGRYEIPRLVRLFVHQWLGTLEQDRDGLPKQRQQRASLLSILHQPKLPHEYPQWPDWEFG